ncbi:hypothetical protein LCGC14_2770390, partial [marine sediment metagenome]
VKVKEGDTVTYTIVVTNPGDQPEMGVMVDDTLLGLTDVMLTAIDTTLGASSLLSPGPLSGGLHDIVFLPLDSSLTYTVTGTVAPPVGSSPRAAGQLLGSAVTVGIPIPDLEEFLEDNVDMPALLLVEPASGGSGIMHSASTVTLAATPRDVALGDLDGDGDLDAFVVTDPGEWIPGEGFPALAILWNDGDGGFTTTQIMMGVSLPPLEFTGVALGDVNGDGYLDAVTSSLIESHVWLNMGDTTFAFGEAFDFGPGLWPKDDVALVELNGDGILDAVFTGAGTTAPQVALGIGDGTFESAVLSEDADVFEQFLALADVDVDGDGEANAIVTSRRADGTFVGVYDSGRWGALSATDLISLDISHVAAALDYDAALDPDGGTNAVWEDLAGQQDVTLTGGESFNPSPVTSRPDVTAAYT